jgi:hypothetical protein
MVGMFSIRRLIESAKTSSLLPAERVTHGVHALTGRVPTIYDRWAYWEHYDMASKQRGQLAVRSLVHVFIHSFVLGFYPASDHGPAMVWVASERDHGKQLLSLPFDVVVALFRRVGHEDVLYMEGRRDGAGVRLSQHDLVGAGLAHYDPYPDISNVDVTREDVHPLVSAALRDGSGTRARARD